MPAKLNKVQVRKEIERIAKERINRVLPALVDRIESDIDKEIERGMRNSPTVQSLTAAGTSELKQELGLTNAEGKVAELIDGVKESVAVTAKQLRGGVLAKKPILEVKVVQDNLRNLANRDFAFQENSPRFRPELLPWLRWLIEGGRRALVKNSRIIRGRPGQGRNQGGSIMSRNDPQGTWAMPPEHAGTITDNFITKVFDSISNNVRGIVNKRVNASISKIKRA